jgi:hypothetical protein
MPSDKPAWKALLARISIFPLTPSPTPPSALDLFRRVWQIEPEEFRGQANPLMPSIAQGKLRDLTVNCFKHPVRTDFNLLPSLPTGASLASIEDTTQLHEELSHIIRVIGEGLISDPVVRVAVFVQFVMPASTFEEVNKILLASMPQAYRMGVTNEEDVVFQVNRPVRLSNIDNILVNIVTKWNAEQINIILGSRVIAASVTFDHNNVPSTTPISSDKQAALLTEGLSKVANLRRDYDMNIAGF